VTFFEEISALNPTNDTFTLGSGDNITGCGFIIFGTSSIECSGVRFYWPGAAAASKTITCSLWQYGPSIGTTTLLASVNVTTTATTNAEYTGTFSTPVALSPGQVYSVSIWETSGTYYSKLGVNNNSDSILGTMFALTSSVLATPYMFYTMVTDNGGGNYCPWSIFKSGASGNAAPINVGGSMYPVNPVFTNGYS